MIFYRFEDASASFDDHSYPVQERRFKLIRETPRGYWIESWFMGKPKWVSKDATKRYAYPDRQMALDSYIKRKEKQIRIMEARTRAAKVYLANAKSINLSEPVNERILFIEKEFSTDDTLEF